MSTEAPGWRRCSSCKTSIDFGAACWVCSVSTCNRPRTGLVFCSSTCWDAHLGVVYHRESYAIERQAPSRAEWEREQKAAGASAAAPATGAARGEREPRRSVAPSAPRPPPAPRSALPRDVLIVITKLKTYVRARSGMNTSDRVVEPLSDAVRQLCDRAIENARREGRKTVLERDFEE
jgi:hypothetical protein